MQYDDEKSYRFHEEDVPDRCFICKEEIPSLMIFRQIKSMMLVHVCRECIYENISDYLLDNTRPWTGEKGKL
jgi:hypothetical protein